MTKYLLLLLLLTACASTGPIDDGSDNGQGDGHVIIPDTPPTIDGRPVTIYLAPMANGSVYRASWQDSTGTWRPFAWAETLGLSVGGRTPRDFAVFNAYTGAVMPRRGSLIRVYRTWGR